VKTIGVALTAVLFSLQALSLGTEQEGGPTYHAESSAHVVASKDGSTYVTENRSFHFAEVLGDSGSYEAVLLLEQTFHNERTNYLEGVVGKATIKAWTITPDGNRELRWTINEDGNEGDVRDRFYRVITRGCCDVPPVYSHYNMLTGKKVFVSNSDLIEIWGNGEGPLRSRYVAFGYAGESELSKPPQLQYGTDKNVAQRLFLVSPREYFEAPEMFVRAGGRLAKSLNLIGSPLTFTIVLKYLDGVEIQIPVVKDAIRPDLARLPKGYSLLPDN
jgi:hypothetical protein